MMGNVEGGHSRSPARTGSASDTPRHQSKSHKVKSSSSHLASRKISRDPSGRTVFYDTHDDADTDKYHTCRSGQVVTDTTHSKDIPAYYFTASQLARSKNISKSHDANLNRVSSVSQKPDVRHIPWSSLIRKSDGDTVSMIVFCTFLLGWPYVSNGRSHVILLMLANSRKTLPNDGNRWSFVCYVRKFWVPLKKMEVVCHEAGIKIWVQVFLGPAPLKFFLPSTWRNFGLL